MTISGREPRRRRGEALLAAGISSILALTAAELVSRRLFGVALRERLPILEVRANALRGYEMVPDTDPFTYQHPAHVNHLGLRGPDVPERARREPLEKADSELRILCLGDSMTYGQGVADEETIPVLLEGALARAASERRREIRVVNGGVRGYGTQEEIALLTELGPRIAPDAVVLLWYPNDLEQPEIAETSRRLERSGPVAFDTGERMEGWPVRRWRARQVLRMSALFMKIHHTWSDWTYHRLTPPQIEEGLERLDRDLDRLAASSRSLGVDVLVATIPTSAALRGPSDEDRLPGRVGAMARSHGFAFVDLAPDLRDLRRALGKSPVLPYDGHYDGEANAVMARRIANALEEGFPARF
jgi:lysophospholipase L1-like esterase